MDDKNKGQEIAIDPLVAKLRTSKEGMFWFRRRRHNDWTDNYTLYRDKVQLNRLIQRQTVNIPLIKTAIKTLLTNIDEPPLLYFTNLDNDDQAEVFYNEYWKYCAIQNKNTIKDIVDKRQVLIYGRSFKQLNIVNGRFYWEVGDPQDWLVDRYIDPADINTARILCHEHIFKPLSSLTTNPIWDIDAVREIQGFYKSQAGLKRAEANMADYVERQARMMQMGDVYAMTPLLGETYIELNEFFHQEYNAERNEDEFWYTVVADDMKVLFSKPLEEVIDPHHRCQDHYWRYHVPATTWGDETERTDFWCDGVADSLRMPNKILNSYYSQDVENRTLRNFGMNYFNSSLTDEGFTPQTFTPEPWGWFPIPAGQKNLQDMVMRVEIPELEDNIEAMNFLIGIAEKASAATSIQQGVQQPQAITLGEVQLLLQNAQERVRSMAVYYTDSWEEFGHKYVKLLEASHDLLDPVMIHRRGRLSKKMYSRRIQASDWKTDTGFTVEVKMKQQKQQEDQNALQWLNAAKTTMPNNPIVDEEYKLKILENTTMSSDKINEALKFDKQQQDEMQQMQQQQNANNAAAMLSAQNPNAQTPPSQQLAPAQPNALANGQQQQLPAMIGM